MDVSADLFELARTPLAVVCSGVKSILDIGKTLEYLETLGVCVTTLDSSGSIEFPSFFTRKSGFQSPFNCRSEADVARLIFTNLKIGFDSGLLIAVPLPEKYACDDKVVENAILEALKEARREKIKGKKVTPFLLEKINKITKGKSLESNLALIKNNARVSGKIAVALKNLKEKNSGQSNTKEKSSVLTDVQVTVVGGINLDMSYRLTDEKTLNVVGVTQPAVYSQTPGGVGRNMTEALVKLGIEKTSFITVIANDSAGKYLIEKSNEMRIDTSRFHCINEGKFSTGMYCAVFGCRGDLKIAYGDMKVHNFISPKLVEKNLESLAKLIKFNFYLKFKKNLN